MPNNDPNLNGHSEVALAESKRLILERLHQVKSLCLKDLNLFLDNGMTWDIVGDILQFTRKVKQAPSFGVLEKCTLELVGRIDEVFQSIAAVGEENLPEFQQNLPSLGISRQRMQFHEFLRARLLPLFTSHFLRQVPLA